MTITVRQAQPNDLEQLTESGEAFIVESGLGDLVQFDLDSWFTTMLEIVDDGQMQFMLVAMDGEKLAGAITACFIAPQWNRKTLYCHEMHAFVLPEYRRHGVGRMLVDALAEEAQRRGCPYMIVTTQDKADGEKVTAWYESQGFRAFERSLTRRL